MIYIIDLGGQYTHVIWRTIRDLGFEVKIVPKNSKFEEIENADGIIFSGGPGSAPTGNFGVVETVIEKVKSEEFTKPILGICMGHQLIAHRFDGTVEKGKHAEYGVMKIIIDNEDELFKEVPKEFNAWVSHFDEVKEVSEDFIGLAHSEVCRFEAIRHKKKNIFGVQFHPEVWHTENGEKILGNFLRLSR